MTEVLLLRHPVLRPAARWWRRCPSATLREDHDELVGYEQRDTRTSLTMGVGNVVINVAWKLVVVAIYAGLYELTPLRLRPTPGGRGSLLFFADDLAYYWFHRVSHENRVFWASHVVHHSSASTTTSRPRCGRPGCR